MKTICICGGGSLGHVVAGFLSARHHLKVNLLTNRPECWQHEILVHTPENSVLNGQIDTISEHPQKVIPTADVVLLCLPGFLIRESLEKIKPFLKSGAFVGSVFSSTGFFFEALNLLDEKNPLWGFQRVPFIARIQEYGKSACLLGYKDSYNIAVERTSDEEKKAFCHFVESVFERPVHLLSNYLEASITNSNPILHTARLYCLFHDWEKGKTYPEQIPFYATWSVESAELLVKMDEELFELLKVLPVSPNYLTPLLDYYESTDPVSLARKIASIPSFKPILSPMKQTENAWIPDFSSRYFTEDFPYGLRYIHQLAHEYHIKTSLIDKVYDWGIRMLKTP